LFAEFVNGQGSGAILNQKVKTGGSAKAAQRRDVESKDDALGNRCKLSL
jgi:hypothetical protein